jgi:hypothetical protein
MNASLITITGRPNRFDGCDPSIAGVIGCSARCGF